MVCMVVPLIYLSFKIKGNISRPLNLISTTNINSTTIFERNLVFFGGVFGLLFVPIFKTVTHLPPYMGMLLSLGVLWIATEILHRKKNIESKSMLTVIGVLRKVDTATIFFFLGILLAVSCLCLILAGRNLQR